MKNKIILSLILILIFSFSICYADSPYPRITEEQALAIKEYFFSINVADQIHEYNNTYSQDIFESIYNYSESNAYNLASALNDAIYNFYTRYFVSSNQTFSLDDIVIFGYPTISSNSSGTKYYYVLNLLVKPACFRQIESGYGNALYFSSYNGSYYSCNVYLSNSVAPSSSNYYMNRTSSYYYPFKTYTINEGVLDCGQLFGLSENSTIYYDTTLCTLKAHLGSSSGSGSGSGSGETVSGDHWVYYNYDFQEYFIRPYLKLDNVQGRAQYSADSATIPFALYSQSGDEYFPFNSLKIDLRVFNILRNDSGESYANAGFVTSYKIYSGDYVDTSGFSSYTLNGDIFKYVYNLRYKFDSSFIDTYLNDADGQDYAFQLCLYDFWGDLISTTDFFYFYDTNALNSMPITNDYYGNLQNLGNSSSNNYNIDTDYKSLINTFTDFMSTVNGFWAILPAWLIALISLGISVAIALRVLGR